MREVRRAGEGEEKKSQETVALIMGPEGEWGEALHEEGSQMTDLMWEPWSAGGLLRPRINEGHGASEVTCIPCT